MIGERIKDYGEEEFETILRNEHGSVPLDLIRMQFTATSKKPRRMWGIMEMGGLLLCFTADKGFHASVSEQRWTPNFPLMPSERQVIFMTNDYTEEEVKSLKQLYPDAFSKTREDYAAFFTNFKNDEYRQQYHNLIQKACHEAEKLR